MIQSMTYYQMNQLMINHTKSKCTLRKNKYGVLLVCGATIKQSLDTTTSTTTSNDDDNNDDERSIAEAKEYIINMQNAIQIQSLNIHDINYNILTQSLTTL